MKKIILGFVLIGSFFSSVSNVNGQASVDPGEGSKWVCCQVLYQAFCTDMAGNGWPTDVKKMGQSCS